MLAVFPSSNIKKEREDAGNQDRDTIPTQIIKPDNTNEENINLFIL